MGIARLFFCRFLSFSRNLFAVFVIQYETKSDKEIPTE